MLIRFSVENYRSFNEEAVFSMLPGRVTKHGDHIIPFSKQGINALRIALLYGANASGKSNLVRAMDFAREYIIEGVRPKQNIPVEPFRLDLSSTARPSRFEFEFVVNDQIYAYGFLVDKKRVHEEWLYLVNSRNEQPLFERETNKKNIVTSSFGQIKNINDIDQQFLDFITKGTRPNQLLLTTLVDRNVKNFEPMYDWFRNTLTIIFPESHVRGIQVSVHEDQKFRESLAKFLHVMNTGIDEVCTKLVDPDSLNLPPGISLESIIEDIDEQDEDTADEKTIVLNGLEGRYIVHHNKEGLLEAYALGTRRYIDKKPIEFELFEESDGTQRLFDLFPVLYGIKDRVFVIDELERSLHPNLVRLFIENFLETDNRSQLIFTTHESTLLDLTLLRRDEVWLVEKSQSGASEAYSLEEFKPRHDLDIRKGYLQGRFGAIPVFGSSLDLDFVEA